MTPKKKIPEILKRLKKVYPDAQCALKYKTPFHLLVATVLSAQCTDKRVNRVTPNLFKKYKNLQDFAKANISELEQDIRSTGFFRNKAKNIKACSQMLVKDFKGKVPDQMDQLVKLPGVARKTANVILGTAYGKNEGICVDTHVTRLSGLIGLTKQKNPVKIEQDLMEITPKKEWTMITHLLINHGRNICIARRPKCEVCAIRKYCDYGVNVGK